jgi:serine/threonine protein kinase
MKGERYNFFQMRSCIELVALDRPISGSPLPGLDPPSVGCGSRDFYAGAFAGTPELASPEQFAGGGVDIRSDLYSLGVTLWEMLIGRTPFRGSSAEVMYQHQHAPLPVEQLNCIPQPLAVLLEVLLAKDPVRRFQTPAELLKVMPTVRDAIDAGRAMMKTIRVFVSSTGSRSNFSHGKRSRNSGVPSIVP